MDKSWPKRQQFVAESVYLNLLKTQKNDVEAVCCSISISCFYIALGGGTQWVKCRYVEIKVILERAKITGLESVRFYVV